MDLSASLEKFRQMAVAGSHVTQLKIPNQDPTVAYVDVGNSIETITIPGPEPHYIAHDLDAIFTMAKTYRKDNTETDIALLYCPDYVQLVFNRRTNFGRMTLKLQQTAEFEDLRAQLDVPMGHKHLIRFLHVKMADVRIDPSDLLAICRTLRFSSGAKSESAIQSDSSSLGRQVEASVSGASKLPEQVAFYCNVYRNILDGDPTNQAYVRTALSFDAETSMLRFDEMGDSVQESVDDAMKGLRDDLERRFKEAGVGDLPIMAANFGNHADYGDD